MGSKHNDNALWAILILMLGGAQYLAGHLYAEPLGIRVGGALFVLGLSWLLWGRFSQN